MAKTFIEQNFWNKTILTKGQHDVKITCIERGKNISTGSDFIICIFENQNGYFPLKITLKLKSEQNFKYVNNLYESVGIENPYDVLNNYQQLKNKKLSIFVHLKASKFGLGLNVNRFDKSK